MSKHSIIRDTLSLFLVLLAAIFNARPALAADEPGLYGIGMSPLSQRVSLDPGETYNGYFTITNPFSHVGDFTYELSIKPFFVDENYNISLGDREGDYNQMVDWITVDGSTEGVVALNSSKKINFSIHVPEDAPSCGQYAAIVVSAKKTENNGGEGVNLSVGQSMAHTIYADVAGDSRRTGEIVNANVPSFYLSGNIFGSSTIQNTGNVHTVAHYILKVFPLFSDEELYTNEEDPQEKLIMPERSLYNVTSWDDTPSIGLFNVEYNIDFNGETIEIKKLVVVCPLWLLVAIVIAIIGTIMFLWYRSKKKDNKEKLQ